MRKWYELSYKSLRETVEYLQQKRAEKEAKMLFIMQYSPFPNAMQEIEQIFKQNKHLKLHRSKIFRAWYKHHKLREKRDPEFYQKLLDIGMTPHELDPYFDANAPDWEQFDTRPHYDYDDEDYDDEDYDDEDYDDEDYDDEEEDEDYDDDKEDDDYEDDDYLDPRRRMKKEAEDGFYTGIGLGVAGDFLD